MKLFGHPAAWVQCCHGKVPGTHPSVVRTHRRRGDSTHAHTTPAFTSPSHGRLPHLPIAFFSVSYVISSAGAL